KKRSVEQLPKLEGICPCKRLLLKSSVDSELSAGNHSGIVPVSRLFPTFNICSLPRFDNVDGNVPADTATTDYQRANKQQNPRSGTSPVNIFNSRASSSRLPSDPNAAGRSPVNSLFSK